MEVLNPVLSLLVRDEHRGILLGVRNPCTNKTHPNVISTPTQRLPYGIADALLQGAELVEAHVPELQFPGNVTHSFHVRHSRIGRYTDRERDEHDPLVSVVIALLARKLCGECVPRFTAHVASVIDGTLLYDKSEALPGMKQEQRDGVKVYSEEVRMIGVEVVLKPGDLFPLRTVAYSHLAYVTEIEFREMVRTKSTEPVAHVFGKNSVMYCVRGMCLQAGYVATEKDR